MTRTEVIEWLEHARVLFIDDDSSIYHEEIWEALGLAIDALECDIYHAKNFVQPANGKWMEKE